MDSGGDTLSPEQIELINAYGPYNHAVWASGGVEITNEERLSGRGEFIVDRIRKTISKHFTMDEISTFSILDVGCYDGWVLNQLSDLPFARMVGVEPREKNIVKGEKVRDVLNIPSRAEFKVGDIGSLAPEQYDIVICTGVLHHVESTPFALQRLKSVCRKLLFIETICLSSRHITKTFKKELEMKDVVYRYKSKTAGVSGQKFESSYYDGSTNKLTVVSIPSVESLMMYLDIYGFNNIEIVADPKSYREAVWKDRRPFNAVCISALVDSSSNEPTDDESTWVYKYESGLAYTLLGRDDVKTLYEIFSLRKRRFPNSLFTLILFLHTRSPGWLSAILRPLVKMRLRDDSALEIVANLRFNPEDKLALEYGKILYHEQDYQAAISVVKAVTQKVNADWRSVYRSFFLLSLAYDKIGMPDESERYKALCLTSNANFPPELFQESLGTSSV